MVFVRAIIAELLYKSPLMKVSRTSTVSPASKKKIAKTKSSGDPAFVRHLQDVKGEADSVSQISDVGGITTVGSILAAQEVDNDGAQRARQQLEKYGEDILDRLDEIKQDLLIGAISRERLANLAQALRMKKSTTNDPALISIIDDIELRAAVELAKYTRIL